jgi:hypothetical protein
VSTTTISIATSSANGLGSFCTTNIKVRSRAKKGIEDHDTYAKVLNDHVDQVDDLDDAPANLRSLEGKVRDIDGSDHLVGRIRELGQTIDVILHRGRVDGRDKAGEGSESKGGDTEELHGDGMELRERISLG